MDVQKSATASVTGDLVLDGGFVTPKQAAEDGFVAPDINAFGNTFRSDVFSGF